METKHTKGEWSIAQNHIESEFKNQYTILSESTHTICEVTRHNYKQVGKSKFKNENELHHCAEALANAKLIASAPDLLEALIKLKPLYQGRNNEYERLINNAIKKATE